MPADTAASPATLILRPTWAEIDLPALGRNLRRLGALAGARCRVLFVVKANAYGHGANAVAAYAQRNALCDMLGVSSVEEGIALRQTGITLPILVLGSIYPFEAFRYALEYDLSVTVSSIDAARQVELAAAETGKTARCHVKVDTGMGRIGARRPGAVKILNFLRTCKHAVVEGTYTHLSSSDADPAYTRTQLRHFMDTMIECSRNDIPTGLRHCANSAAAEGFPECRLDMIRPGYAAYGLAEDYSPVLALKTRVVYIKDLRKGASVSYGRGYRCRSLTRVATLPVGYGDGYMRALSNRAEVLIRGRRCRVIGTITMDMMMADVSALPDLTVGEEAVLIGRQGEDEITAAELAGLAGTISYEITTAVSTRVPRVFTDEQ